MSFSDLPKDWPDRPLTDPVLVADVLDLVVSERSRAERAIYLLLCDPDDRLVLPIALDEVGPDTPAQERVTVLSVILSARPDLPEPGSVLVAIARPGGLSTTADDHAWADAAAAAAAGRWRLLGVHLVTADGSRPVPRATPAA